MEDAARFGVPPRDGRREPACADGRRTRPRLAAGARRRPARRKRLPGAPDALVACAAAGLDVGGDRRREGDALFRVGGCLAAFRCGSILEGEPFPLSQGSGEGRRLEHEVDFTRTKGAADVRLLSWRLRLHEGAAAERGWLRCVGRLDREGGGRRLLPSQQGGLRLFPWKRSQWLCAGLSDCRGFKPVSHSRKDRPGGRFPD